MSGFATEGRLVLRRRGVPIVLALILLLVLLLNHPGVLAPDIKPEIYMAPWREAQALSRAWRESPKLGEPNFNVGLFPVAWVVGVIQAIGFDADLSMRALRWVLLLVGGWGASRLYGLVAGPQRRPIGHVIAAVLYVANPYMVTAGDFLAIVLPAAFLPWMALFLLRAATAGGWRYPAAAALCFAAMSGMNAAVIPLIQLLCLPAVLWYAARGLGVGWRRTLIAAGKWGLLAGLLSVYWLVPSVAALGAGSHVTHFSESLAGIAGSSSFGEVIRGLGLWVLYGRDADGPWQPGFAAYLDNPLVIAASFLLPLLAVLSALVVRGPARRFTLLLAVPATVLMVGAHPVSSPTPFGRVVLWAFEHVPGAAAFRTTNKVGAVMVLGLVLLCALAAPEILRRARRFAPRPVLAVVAAGALVINTWPAWTGGLYSLPLPVPDYWYKAADALDRGPADRRVWFLPGVAQPQYTWSEDRPDDLNNAVLSRPSFVRITLPESSPYGASLLAAVDTGLQEGTLPAGTLSASARYLGVGDVLVRHDVRWDKAGGARPLDVALQVGSDPGFRFTGADGAPGEGILRTADQPQTELDLPPLQRYEVSDSRAVVRSEALDGLVLVDGDGWALAPLVQVGLLPAQPVFTFTSALRKADLVARLGSTSRLVLTDTNRRREVTPNRLTSAYGPVVAASTDPGPTIALGDEDSQTVLVSEGGAVTSTQDTPEYGVNAASSPENAFDANPTTAWTFGEFGEALGQSVTVRPSKPVAVDEVAIDIPPTVGQRITALRVEADGAAKEVKVPGDGRVAVAFPGVRATVLTVTVTGIEGEGDNPVSIADVSAPGLHIRRVARLPIATTTALERLDTSARSALAATPTDVVLTRVAGQATPVDDEERRLDRDFTLPADRDFRVYGLVRPDASAPDDMLDTVLGVTGNAVARSSSRAFDAVEVRGSRAFDGNPKTGWIPGRGVRGEWLEATLSRRHPMSYIVVEQPSDASTWVTRAEVLVDDAVVATATLSPGRVRIPFPETVGRTLRLRVTDYQGTGFPIISEIEAAGARVAPAREASSQECMTLGTLDGVPLKVRPVGAVDGEGPRLVAGCDTVRLAAGKHRLRSLPGWAADTLVLRDTLGEAAVPGRAGPQLSVDRTSAAEYHVSAAAADEPYVLVVGQNIHPGWTATMDGADLGPATVVDGYAMGWVIRDLDAHTFRIRYAAQGASDVALAVSGGGLIVAGALLVIPSGPRSPEPARPAPVRQAPARQAPVGQVGRRAGRRWPWLVFILGCGVFAGVAGALAGLVVALWVVLRRPSSGTLVKAAALAMALAPLAWVIGNVPRWGQIGPQLVLANPAPSVLVIASLVCLLAGSRGDEDAGGAAAHDGRHRARTRRAWSAPRPALDHRPVRDDGRRGDGGARDHRPGADDGLGHDHRTDDPGAGPDDGMGADR